MPESLITHNEDNTQERILRSYTVLRLVRPDWGGALVISCGLGPQGAPLAMAANMAGAACLSIEENPDLLKAALRSGSCDFIVNTLDEALRAMKNEVRKHLPISVGLRGEPDIMLHECLDRGVQPELVIDLAEEPATRQSIIQQMRSHGAMQLDFLESTPGEDIVSAAAILSAFLEKQQWTLRSFPANDAIALRTFDARALDLLAKEETLRRQWLRLASRIVQRQRPLRRALWLTKAEAHTLDGT
jgi:hypothetical protein